jgi:hypothetical protein
VANNNWPTDRKTTHMETAGTKRHAFSTCTYILSWWLGCTTYTNGNNSLWTFSPKSNTLCWPLALILITTAIITTTFTARSVTFPTISINERIAVSDLEQRTSIQERFDFFEGAATLAIQRPLIGYGPMSFGYIYRSIQKQFLGISDHPHNWPLRVAAENGIPAFFLLITFLLYVGYHIIQNTKSYLVFFASVAILGGILHNLVDYNLNFILNIVTLWILAALVMNQISTNQVNAKRELYLIPLIISALIFTVVVREGALIVRINKDDGTGRTTYEQTLTPRNYFIKRAQELMESAQFLAARDVLEQHLVLNPHDPVALNLASETSFNADQTKEGYELAKRSLEVDALNNLGTYKMVLFFANILKDEKQIEILRPRTKKLLLEYRYLFDTNAHFTVFTDNPFHAAWLHTFFDQPKEAEYYLENIDMRREEVIKANNMTWEVPFVRDNT